MYNNNYFFVEFSYFGNENDDVYKVLCIQESNMMAEIIKYIESLSTEDIYEKVYTKITFLNQDYNSLDFYFLNFNKAQMVIDKYSSDCD